MEPYIQMEDLLMYMMEQCILIMMGSCTFKWNPGFDSESSDMIVGPWFGCWNLASNSGVLDLIVGH